MFNRIFIALKERNIRQEALANFLKVSPATISRWCRNISQPEWKTLLVISNFLKTDIKTLLYGTPKTITIKGETDLSSLGVNDAFLQMVTGKTNLLNIQGAYFKVHSDFRDGSTSSYPLSLISYASLYQNPKIPAIEVGEVIENCKYTKLKMEGCKEELNLLFLCPEPTVVKASRKP